MAAYSLLGHVTALISDPGTCLVPGVIIGTNKRGLQVLARTETGNIVLAYSYVDAHECVAIPVPQAQTLWERAYRDLEREAALTHSVAKCAHCHERIRPGAIRGVWVSYTNAMLAWCRRSENGIHAPTFRPHK